MRRDKDQIIMILDRAGVTYEPALRMTFNEERHQWENLPGSEIVITAGDGDANIGYSGFFSVLTFDEEGSLQSWGNWE